MKLPNYSNSLVSKEPSRERLEYRRPSHLAVYLLVLDYLIISPDAEKVNIPPGLLAPGFRVSN